MRLFKVKEQKNYWIEAGNSGSWLFNWLGQGRGTRKSVPKGPSCSGSSVPKGPSCSGSTSMQGYLAVCLHKLPVQLTSMPTATVLPALCFPHPAHGFHEPNFCASSHRKNAQHPDVALGLFAKSHADVTARVRFLEGSGSGQL